MLATEYYSQRESLENEANAHLIAAAPELLEALKECVDNFSIEVSMNDTTIAKAIEAIAKAEGK